MKTSEALLYLKNNPNKIDKRYGICGNTAGLIRKSFYKTMIKSGISFSDWNHFSGSNMFPVPVVTSKGLHKHISPAGYYNLYHIRLWSKRTKYGQLRWQLLDWLIEQFQNVGD